ncbi:MAG: NAD-dependent DNA ligase LigA [Lachnospiraceae bacterium]
MEKITRMKELVTLLNEASKAYYQESREIMSNYDYDKLYDELVGLEKETGITLGKSPTISVGYQILSELPKETHASPMLSLDKTKDVEQLKIWLKNKTGILSWKLDGLTIVLTYENGTLLKAVTRGNGEVGEVITGNAKTFVNVPLNIGFQGRVVIRGEAVIKYSDFHKMNEQIVDLDAKYKNPRNLCAGSVRQLNSEITAGRNVNFFAFSLIEAAGIDFHNSREKQLEWLKRQGFDVVEYVSVTAETMDAVVGQFEAKIPTNDIPSDGLVLLFDDIAYGESLGMTAKFPRNAIAFKWADETAETKLNYIEWSPSRTGLINPVAVFDPVSLEGTTVSRASVHNLSIMESLELGEGDTITVYKANMIIPQIAENLTRSGSIKIPEHCPVCGGETEVKKTNDVKSLFCINPDCQAKRVKSFELFVSRDAMNIDGLSGATLEKFIVDGFIKEFADIFELDQFREQIVSKDGFGEKSYENLMKSINTARKTTLIRVIYSLGIPGIGLSNAKMLCKVFANDFNRMRHATEEELVAVDGIGQVLARSWVNYFEDEKNQNIVDHLLLKLEIEKEEASDTEQIFMDKVFVITGSVTKFKNRNELKAYIEERGGKVTGSVTTKTNYLINNDTTSNSSKNKKAKELNIPILSEDDLLGQMDRR